MEQKKFLDAEGVEQIGREVAKVANTKQNKLAGSEDVSIGADGKLSVTENAKREVFIDLWDNAARTAGRYNPATGYFELNGITDISYEEAISIYNNTYATYAAFNNFRSGIAITYVKPRTTLPSLTDCARQTYPDVSGTYSTIEVLSLVVKINNDSTDNGNKFTAPKSQSYNYKISRWLDRLKFTTTNQTYNYRSNWVLSEFYFVIEAPCTITMVDSPMLSVESFEYMVQNSITLSSPATIKIDQVVFDRLPADLIEAAAAKNITFVV